MTSETSPDQRKELKTRIPARQHIALHQLKVLRGKRIETMIEEALDVYLSASARKAGA